MNFVCKVCTESNYFPEEDLCLKCTCILSEELNLNNDDLINIITKKFNEKKDFISDMIVEIDPNEQKDICKICEDIFWQYQNIDTKICQNCEFKGPKYISKIFILFF